MRLSPRVIAAVVLLLILVVVVATVSANAGTTTPRKVMAYFRNGATGQSVPLPQHQETEVLRLRNVRPGHYLISAAVNVRGAPEGEHMYVGCWILAEDIFASGQVRFGPLEQQVQSQHQMPLEGAGTLTAPGPITVECSPGGGLASATVHGLTALRVPLLDDQTPVP